MHESLSANLMLCAALLSSLAGMAWLALSMQVHALQVWQREPSPSVLRLLRIRGCCLVGGHYFCSALFLTTRFTIVAISSIRPRKNLNQSGFHWA